MATNTSRLPHGRIELALFRLREADGPNLLLLHELGSQAPRQIPTETQAWAGNIWALDFTGHGESTVPRGGGYSAEILMADADCALAHIGPATVLGHGLGGYVALLLAGSRPELVRGAIVCTGAGLEGGGPEPFAVGSVGVRPAPSGPPDSQALNELSRDIRPPGYAQLFVRQAAHVSKIHPPITIASDIARPFPPWLETVAEAPGTTEQTAAEALEKYQALEN